MKYIILYILILLLLFISNISFSQQVISSAGTHATGTNVQLSWTVGEPVIETFTVGSNMLTQGFQQSRLTITAIEPDFSPDLQLTVYPNPVSASMKLEINTDRFKEFSFNLYNMDGKKILNRKVESNTELINMESYAPGTYLLIVLRDERQSIKTFKIMKN